MKSGTKILAIVIVILVVAFFMYWFSGNARNQLQNSSDNNRPIDELKTQEPTENSQPVSTSNGYKDGSYNVTVDYMSPGGKDSLGVKVNISNGLVADLAVANMAGDKTSNNYQNKFIANIQSSVVGKSLGDLKVDVVSGASLTSNAFNNALNQIRSQAQTN